MAACKMFISLFCTVILQLPVWAQQHPHLLVNANDKSAVLEKIARQPWSGSIYKGMQNRIDLYADRHKTNPQWILGRYIMNRVPGKRYTRVYADNGGQLLYKWEGDAPFPTVRISSHLRTPVTPSGASYRRPSLEEVVPNDTSRLMYLLNTETNQKEWIDPQQFVASINENINSLALDAAIMYWLKGDEKYAKFAADILDQWAKGAYYQEPIIGPCRTGFMDIQTLGDRSSLSLIFAYDFVYPFMKKNGYDLHYYENVFEKIASTLAFRGFYNNNWYAAESSTLVSAALSLENTTKRDYYLKFYLQKDTINGGCGQLALPSTVEKWLTQDGHWKEPGGYHNYPVSNLLISALICEKNGYDVFKRFPALFKASYVMLKYSFPDLTESAYGDSGRASQSPESLEIGLLGAVKYNQPELPEKLASMKKLIEGGKYRRENSGYLGLLCFLPELPAVESTYTWPRSGNLDFSHFYLQRNGTDPQLGLMYGVQGGSYNHNHCNGMAMELYGLGQVLGIDAGTGPNYEHPLHVNYFSQWAAHNTVVAAGSSSSVPHSGSAGRKDIGQIELASMEPMPDRVAVSPVCSFTDTRYFDKSTKTNEMRTLGIIRTSEKSGYYIDIYRSDNTVSNDYIYHSIGNQVVFLNSSRESLKSAPAVYPLTGDDYPGFRFFTEVNKLENFKENIIALFSIKDEQSNSIFMQVLVPGKTGRVYYHAKSPKTHTSGRVYANKTLPVFTMRDNGESRSIPFIAVYEPYRDNNSYTVDRISVEQRNDGQDFTALTVFNRDLTKQIIFQSLDPSKTYTSGKSEFSGYFGVAGLAGDGFSYLYLGDGSMISFNGYSLKISGQKGSANLSLSGKIYKVSCNQNTLITVPAGDVKSVSLMAGAKTTKLPVTKTATAISFTVNPVMDGQIIIE